ncbi:MAG: hypothetical protein Q9201_006495 [Fulgogasparrea decipioides]
MADVAANAAALAHLAHRLIEYCHDVYKAPEEQATILDSAQGVLLLVQKIEVREASARQNPKDAWYQGLLSLCASAPPISKRKALTPDPIRVGDGALVRLNKNMAFLKDELLKKHGIAGIKQRILWTYNKKRIQELVAAIDQLRALVGNVLQLDHIELSQANHDLILQNIKQTEDSLKVGLETNNYAQNLSSAAADTVSHLQELQNKGSAVEASVQEVRTTINETNERIKRQEQQEERRAIIEWLSPLQYRRRQSEIFNDATEMGLNFLDSDEYKAWSAGRPWLLYGFGLPGSGKTVLSSIVVNQLQRRFASAGVPVLCMYLNYKEHKQTLTALIGSLLKQLIQFVDGDLKSTEVRRLFREAAREASPLLEDLYTALRAEIMTFSRVILVIDALDEASSIEAQLIDRIYKLPQDKLSVMITSRPRDDVDTTIIQCSNCSKRPLKISYNCNICDGGNFDLCQSCVDQKIHCHDKRHQLVEAPEVRVDIEPTDDEIRRYVENELTKELKLGSVATRNRRNTTSTRGKTRLGVNCQNAPELQTMIPDYILANCRGMFMLAKLFMTAIRTKTSPDEVKATLENLPQGYDESYKATMERIEATGLADPNDTSSGLAKRTLMWVACSYRTLSLAELQEALAIDLKRPDYRTKHQFNKEILLEITGGLLYIDSDEKNVRLCHATAHEYFKQSRDQWFAKSASQIAQCCLLYLSRPEYARPCEGMREDEEFEKRQSQNPFMAYAYPFWGDHVCDAGHDEIVQEAVIRYLEDSKRVAAFTQAAWYLNSLGAENWDVRKGANSLHVATWFGLEETIPWLIQQGFDVNSADPQGETPLMYACRKGNDAVATLLLERGASVNVRSFSESTALFEAVHRNHKDVVTVLLRDASLGVNDEHLQNAERTALMFAAKDNYFGILDELLHDHRTDVNKQDVYGATALSIASIAGHLQSVIRLLQHEKIDINSADQQNCTALMSAAVSGHDEIVQELLASRADLSKKDKEGGTALLRAIDNGHSTVVRTMLQYDCVDIFASDTYGRTLLHGAAVNGHAEIVRLLIEKGLDRDVQDTSGRTPLHEASRNGKPDVVKTLLNLGATSSLKDRWDRSAWDVAWLHGQTEVMLLLEGKPVDASSKQALLSDYPNLTTLPIWSLAQLGRADILRSAIVNRRGDLFHLDPDTENTALHVAILADRSSILDLLLEAGLNPDSQNAQSRTPLHLAAFLGSLSCTQSLLAYSPNLNLLDEFHQTPLLIAQIKAWLEIALLLIEAGANIDPHTIRVQDFFFAAVEFARPKALQILIDKGAKVVEKNVAGKTALRLAKDLGAEEIGEEAAERMGEVIRILQENKSRFVRMDSKDGVEKMSVEEDEDGRAFQMSAFRRKDIWEEEEKAVETRRVSVPEAPPTREAVPA